MSWVIIGVLVFVYLIRPKLKNEKVKIVKVYTPETKKMISHPLVGIGVYSGWVMTYEKTIPEKFGVTFIFKNGEKITVVSKKLYDSNLNDVEVSYYSFLGKRILLTNNKYGF